MNYLQLEERKRLYRERTSIEEFENDGAASINTWFLENLHKTNNLDVDGSEQLMLDIFNNAYYITTAVLMEKHRVQHFDEFISIASSVGGDNNPCKLYFAAITMGMVHVYLVACDEKYQMDYDVLKEKILYFNYENPYTSYRIIKTGLQKQSPQDYFSQFIRITKMKDFHEKFGIDHSVFATLTEGADTQIGHIEQIQQRIKELETENDQLKNKLSEKEVQASNAWEKIIFFANILSAAYDDEYTNQQALSELICLICGGKTSTFQPRISRLAKMGENDKYEQEVLNAARNLISKLGRVTRGNDVGNNIIQNLMNNIKAEFNIT